MNASEHLRPETIFGYEHKLLIPEELRQVHAHIDVCPACRAQLAARMELPGMAADVKAGLAAAPAQVSGFAFSRYAAAAAILLVSATALWLMRGESPQAEEQPVESAAVREALRTGSLALPAFLKDLAPGDQVLMGQATPAAPSVLSPNGTAVLGPRAEFHWSPMAGGGRWSYHVRVFTLAGEQLAESGDLAGTQWTVDHDLPVDTTLQWQITATQGAERITLPPPSVTPPKFRIVDPATAGRLRDLARRSPNGHLELGVEYGRAGLLDDARRELTEAARAKPSDTAIAALLRSLPSSLK